MPSVGRPPPNISCTNDTPPTCSCTQTLYTLSNCEMPEVRQSDGSVTRRFLSLRKYNPATAMNAPAIAARTWYLMVLAAALGDLAVFGIFVAVGGAEHGVGYGGAAMRTALPFAAAWFAISPWLGAFRVSTMMSLWDTAWKIPLIFLACGVIAIVLRAWLTDRGLQLTFTLVAIGTQTVMLFWWRAALALSTRRLIESR